MASRRIQILGVVAAGVVAALLAGGYWAIHANPPQSNERHVADQKPPQLYCMFIRFSGEPRLEFLFNIDPVGNALRFEQLYLVEIAGQNKNVKEAPFPGWHFDTGDEPTRLESEISVYDNSAAGSHTEKITIELYDYRPEKSSGELIESGLKSIHYQNLSGKCRQTRPALAASMSD